MLKSNIFHNQISDISTDGIAELVQTVWNAEGQTGGEINIILVDDDKMVELNRAYLNRDYKTDVIAFPLSDEAAESFEGEIYISVDRVVENAIHFEVPAHIELRRMVVHGVLHFLHYSDKTVAGKERMTAREDHYLRQFELS